jgi:2,3-bisphosphoglycerate-independent phosphoglycerate mutase
MSDKKVALIILDGWGIGPENEGNAIYLAKKPNFDSYLEQYSHTSLSASGRDVGLPKGQMGNSEVGHLNIGAGHIVYQDISMIDNEIENGSFFENKPLNHLMDYVNSKGSALHLMGLVSNGGVHSSMEHIRAVIKLAKEKGVNNLFIHAYLDGRDTPPRSAVGFIRELEGYLSEFGIGKIASVAGRYYAMDRDKNWDRLKKAYDLLTLGEGFTADSAVKAVEDAYGRDENDEFVKPTIIKGVNGIIKDNDGVFFFNFRPDRGREMSMALTEKDFKFFERKKLPDIKMLTMTQYQDGLNVDVVYPPEFEKNTMGEYLSSKGKKQLRIAETEKYAHVTYFFNGGNEKIFDNEKRVLIASPKVATYDLKPEMSAYEVKDRLIKETDREDFDLIVLNFANPDMVGHTGILPAAVKAICDIDICLGEVVTALRKKGYKVIITADHGNADEMINFATNTPHTAHTTNPVPLIIIDDKKYDLVKEGRLSNIAPTILELMGIEPCSEISEKSLII